MAKISMRTTIQARSEEVWKTIRDFGRVGEYVAGISATQTEGSGVGSLRRLTLTNENQVLERLESLNDSEKTLSYSVLETPLSMTGYVATMKLRDTGNGQCELLWESAFQAPPDQEPLIKKIIERLYAWGFEGLKRIHES